jgi:hypothetical protein
MLGRCYMGLLSCFYSKSNMSDNQNEIKVDIENNTVNAISKDTTNTVNNEIDKILETTLGKTEEKTKEDDENDAEKVQYIQQMKKEGEKESLEDMLQRLEYDQRQKKISKISDVTEKKKLQDKLEEDYKDIIGKGQSSLDKNIDEFHKKREIALLEAQKERGYDAYDVEGIHKHREIDTDIFQGNLPDQETAAELLEQHIDNKNMEKDGLMPNDSPVDFDEMMKRREQEMQGLYDELPDKETAKANLVNDNLEFKRDNAMLQGMDQSVMGVNFDQGTGVGASYNGDDLAYNGAGSSL